MTLAFSDPAWWTSFVHEVNADERFFEAAAFVSARIGIKADSGTWTIDIRDGKVISTKEGLALTGDDIVLIAPDREWERVVDGQVDWFETTSPGLGEMTFEGNAVMALRNIKVMWRLLAAMAKAGKPPVAPGPYSPDPVWSGREILGKYVDVDGLRTHYEEAGEGQPIVCIHAACQDTMMYRHVLDGLSDSYRVISIDAPGHGKTLEPAGGPFDHLSKHAEFNEKFMAALGLEKPIIIGCSMGGNQVLELGARRPEFYAGIVSCEGADYTPTVSPFFLEMLLLNAPQILECWSQSLTGQRTPPDRAREVVWQIIRTAPEYARGDLVGYAGFDKRDVVGNIKSPVLLLRGDADWLVPQAMVEETSSRIPGSKIEVLSGTGHYPMIENPVEFNQAIRSFAESVA